MRRRSQRSAVLVHDLARCQTSVHFQEAAAQARVDLVHIPARMTGLLQPADVFWICLIKRMFRRRWQHWFVHEEKSYTRSGNMKSPGYEICVEWQVSI
jgi:hypothetical protein